MAKPASRRGLAHGRGRDWPAVRRYPGLFLCEFSEHNESGSIKDLKALIRLLVSQKKELPTIINTVQERTAKTHNGTCAAKRAQERSWLPDWSRASISRHLVYSTEFPELFTNVVTQIYQSLIMKLNTKW